MRGTAMSQQGAAPVIRPTGTTRKASDEDSHAGRAYLPAGCGGSNINHQGNSMKSITKAVVVGSLILAAQAAVADGSAFPGAADDAGVRLAPNVTYAGEHASDRVTDVGSAYAGSAPGWYILAPNVTYASEHANDPVTTAGSAFPGESDDAGVHLTARTTYADTHLQGPAQVAQPAEDAKSGN